MPALGALPPCLQTYRGYNYPHQAGTWFGMYRAARYYDRLTTYLP